jgi:hypothetical protein
VNTEAIAAADGPGLKSLGKVGYPGTATPICAYEIAPLVGCGIKPPDVRDAKAICGTLV